MQDISMAKAIVHAYEKGVRENKGAVGLSHEGQDVMIDAYVQIAKRTTVYKTAPCCCKQSELLKGRVLVHWRKRVIRSHFPQTFRPNVGHIPEMVSVS